MAGHIRGHENCRLPGHTEGGDAVITSYGNPPELTNPFSHTVTIKEILYGVKRLLAKHAQYGRYISLENRVYPKLDRT